MVLRQPECEWADWAGKKKTCNNKNGTKQFPLCLQGSCATWVSNCYLCWNSVCAVLVPMTEWPTTCLITSHRCSFTPTVKGTCFSRDVSNGQPQSQTQKEKITSGLWEKCCVSAPGYWLLLFPIGIILRTLLTTYNFTVSETDHLCHSAVCHPSFIFCLRADACTCLAFPLSWT